MLKPLLLVFLLAVNLAAVSAQAHSPVKFLEVLQGQPANLIEHGVDLKSVFDKQKVTTDLAGPYLFSIAVGGMGQQVSRDKAYLAWYKIVDGAKDAPRKVSVLDLVRGANSPPLTIESAEYFLSPAQRITTGAPAVIPHGLDHYKAYRIADAPSQNLDLKLTESEGPSQRRVGKPLFLCVATEEWHHEEHFPATHQTGCFVVYELDSREQTGDIGLIDQFGLNQLRIQQSKWLCVRAMLLPDGQD